MWKEFRDFITKGNLVQIAIAFIIGAAFGALVKSFVFDIIMPLIGKAVGNVDFSNLYINLSGTAYPSAQAARDAGAAAIYYGAFINVLINFLIIGLIMFLVVKAAAKMEKPKLAAAPTIKTCPYCKTEIPIDAVRCPHCTAELPGA
ncbi:large conductance mechanosensitive channel protein MscL [Candidatus Bipolaricaulota bacterium]|nr:large conductance mechanosensitive channel protein MscL [Candidatus Bipolaricaulota bacterium]